VLISLLRTSLPLSKQHLQKLFLNLAAHSSSREQLLKMLLSLLRSLPGTSASDAAEGAADEASDSMQTATSGRAGMDISEDGSSQQQQQPSQGLSAMLDRLGAVESLSDAAAASQAAHGADAVQAGLSGSPRGKPAVVSRRVLDMLSYLARNSSSVSRKMLSLRIPEPSEQAKLEADAKGKGKMVAPADAEAALPPRAVEVLLAMLSAPLCQRSVSLLEQLMLLMEVVLTMVQRHEADLAALAALEQAQLAALEQAQERQRGQQQREREQAAEPQQQQDAAQPAAGATEPAAQQQQQKQPSVGVDKQQKQDKEKQQQQKQKQPPLPSELASTMASVPSKLLRQLPGLLAREVLSEPAYASIAKVIKLIVESAPAHLPLMLSELVEGAAGVADALLSFLDTAAQRGIDADAQLAPAIGTKSSVVLRMLYALQGFQTEVQERVKQQEQQRQQEQEQQQHQEAAAGPSSSAAAAAGGSGSGAGGRGSGAGGSGSRAADAAGPSSSGAAAAAAGGSGGASSSAAALEAGGSLDPAAAAEEVNKAVAAVAARTAPLWKSLSSCILRIEDNLRAVLPQHTQAGGESVGNAAARLLPPGAQQVLPLVEAFFVLCALQGALPAALAPAKDLLTAPSMDLTSILAGGATSPAAAAATAAAAAGAGAPAAVAAAAAGGSAAAAAAGGGSGALSSAGSLPLWRPSSMNLGEAASGVLLDATLPFSRFAERHRRLLNAYIRRNTSLLESSLAPLLRVPKLIDFDNKRAYFRCVACCAAGVLQDMHSANNVLGNSNCRLPLLHMVLVPCSEVLSALLCQPPPSLTYTCQHTHTHTGPRSAARMSARTAACA
jgi:hypothetical protein